MNFHFLAAVLNRRLGHYEDKGFSSTVVCLEGVCCFKKEGPRGEPAPAEPTEDFGTSASEVSSLVTEIWRQFGACDLEGISCL